MAVPAPSGRLDEDREMTLDFTRYVLVALDKNCKLAPLKCISDRMREN